MGSFGPCQILNRALIVAIGGESVTVASGHSATVGGLVINLDGAAEYTGGGCDSKSETNLAGFRAP